MSTRAVTPDASAASSPVREARSIEEALTTGFLPDDPGYRETGKFSAKTETQEPEPKTEPESEPQQHGEVERKEDSASSSERDDEHAAPPKGAQPQEKTEAAPQSENRYRKLSRENRELRERLARLEGREEGRTSGESRESKQTSPAAAEGPRPEPKIDDKDAAGKPKYANYDEYLRDLRKWDRDEAIREFGQQTAQTEAQRRQQAEFQQIGKKLNEKFDKVRSKHADFDQVALGEHVLIPFGSVVDRFLQDSDVAGEVVYHLGQHPEILEGFYDRLGKDKDGKPSLYAPDGKGGYKPAWGNKISPERQFRKLMEIEAQFSGAKKETVAPVKPITRASRPPTEVSSQGAVAKDAVEQAIEDSDFETYRKTANERDSRVRSLK